MTARAAPLTEAQRKAVAHRSGPLLIVAGAGTGKTRVLVERYRRLRQEGIPAERILLLTFTEKAAREVLDRVEEEDYLPAGERFVMTYHAFAQRFLHEEGWLGGVPKGFRIVSEVRKWELMRDVLFGQRPAHLFHPQRPYERIGELLKLVERAKQELVSPPEVQAWPPRWRRSTTRWSPPSAKPPWFIASINGGCSPRIASTSTTPSSTACNYSSTSRQCEPVKRSASPT